MLSVGQNAHRFSPSQNIHVNKPAATEVGNVHYRQHIPQEVQLASQRANGGDLWRVRIGCRGWAPLSEGAQGLLPCANLTHGISWRRFARAFSCSIPIWPSASQPFLYDTFAVAPEDTVGRKLYELGDGQWDIPELRTLARDYHFWRPGSSSLGNYSNTRPLRRPRHGPVLAPRQHWFAGT